MGAKGNEIMPRIVKPAPELLKFLSVYDTSVQEIFLATRLLVAGLSPKAQETVWDAYNAVSLVFSFTGKWTQAFIHIAAYSSHVNLGFNNGATFNDPKKKLEGRGSKIRHLKIKTLADLKAAHITKFIRTAIAEITDRGFGPGVAKVSSKPEIRKMNSARRRPKVAKQKPSARHS